MPTFLVLKGSKVIETVRGANPSALRSAILSAAADAAKDPAKSSASPVFSSKGQTLGGAASSGSGRAVSSPSIPSLNLGQLFSAPASFAQGQGLPATIVRFLGLYISTLFSFDPNKTAEDSPFAMKRTNVRSR